MTDNKEDLKILMKAMFEKGFLMGYKNGNALSSNYQDIINRCFEQEWNKLQDVVEITPTPEIVVEATLDEVFPLPKKKRGNRNTND